MWQWLLDLIDSVESWLVLLPLWGQIPLLLVILAPLCWWLAKIIDRVVEFFLRRHNDQQPAVTETATPISTEESSR